MFLMREKTHKTICRVVFVVACVLPTMVTCGWIVWRLTPFHAARQRAHWEAVLSEHTALTARIQTATLTRQNTTVLGDVELTDPETKDRIALLNRMEIAIRDDQVIVSLHQSELKAAYLDRFRDALQRKLQAAHPWKINKLSIAADRLTLLASRKTDDRTLTDIQALVETTGDGARATAEFRVAGLTMNEPARLFVQRNRQVAPPATIWEFRTGSAALPCLVVRDVVTPLDSLGTEATFRGTIWGSPGETGWDLDVQGQFEHVNLDQLITTRFPHKLSGESRFTLNRAEVRGGRTQHLSGTLTSSRGVVSRTLLLASADWMKTGLANHVSEADADLIAYQQMSIAFEIDQNGLRVCGQCGDKASKVIMTDSAGDPMVISSTLPLPVVSLVRVLAPDSEIQVPASRETSDLLRALPVPSIVRPARLGSRRPYSPLRLDE